MAKIGIFYGSTSGNTERVAQKIQEAFGSERAELHNVASASVDDLQQYNYLMIGASTWGAGDLQDDWFDGLDKLDKVDFSNKTVTLFGTGDQEGYPDSFVDAIGILYEKVTAKGATVVGFRSTEGYTYDASRAEKDGCFVGLAIDEDNQSDLTDERINNWVEGLKAKFK